MNKEQIWGAVKKAYQTRSEQSLRGFLSPLKFTPVSNFASFQQEGELPFETVFPGDKSPTEFSASDTNLFGTILSDI